MNGTTTAHALDARASSYVASLDADDDLAIANRMIDEALALQDAGRFAEAEALLNRAESLVDRAEELLGVDG